MNLCNYEIYDSNCVCLNRDVNNNNYKQSDTKNNICCGTIPYAAKAPLTDNLSTELDSINTIPLCTDWWTKNSTQKDRDRYILQTKIFNKFSEAKISETNEYYTLSCESGKLPRLLEFPSLNNDFDSETEAKKDKAVVCVSDSINKIKNYDFWDPTQFNLGYIKNCDPTENECTTNTPYEVDFYYFSKSVSTNSNTFNLEYTSPFILGATGSTGSTGSTGNTGGSSNTGLIIGIIVGVVVLLIIIGIVLYFVFRKKPSESVAPTSTGPGSSSSSSSSIINPNYIQSNVIQPSKQISDINTTTITSTIKKTYEPNFDYNSLSDLDSSINTFESDSNKAVYSINQTGTLPNFL